MPLIFKKHSSLIGNNLDCQHYQNMEYNTIYVERKKYGYGIHISDMDMDTDFGYGDVQGDNPHRMSPPKPNKNTNRGGGKIKKII